MNTISRTLAAFALTLTDKEEAERLFDFARVCEGHEVPRIDHFQVMQNLMADRSTLPDFLPESGLHRKSFAPRAGRALVRRVFDHAGEAPDYASLLKINASALLCVIENLSLSKVAAAIKPSEEITPLFVEDEDGTHGGGPNAIHLPGMVLTYSPVQGLGGETRFDVSLWLMNGQHKDASASTRAEATQILQDWVTNPAKVFQSHKENETSDVPGA